MHYCPHPERRIPPPPPSISNISEERTFIRSPGNFFGGPATSTHHKGETKMEETQRSWENYLSSDVSPPRGSYLYGRLSPLEAHRGHPGHHPGHLGHPGHTATGSQQRSGPAASHLLREPRRLGQFKDTFQPVSTPEDFRHQRLSDDKDESR